MAEPKVVQVEVHGQKYPIRTELDPELRRGAGRSSSRRGWPWRRAARPSSDAVGLAILTALNITDEYFRTRTALTNSSGTLTARAEALEKMVDQALALAE